MLEAVQPVILGELTRLFALFGLFGGVFWQHWLIVRSVMAEIQLGLRSPELNLILKVWDWVLHDYDVSFELVILRIHTRENLIF